MKIFPHQSDFICLDEVDLRDGDDAWEQLKAVLFGDAQRKRMAKRAPRGRGRPASGPGSGSNLQAQYPGENLTNIQVLMRKASEMDGRVSQPKLAEALGISTTTVWRIVDESGVGWPLPPFLRRPR